jgi:hypothetical protein
MDHMTGIDYTRPTSDDYHEVVVLPGVFVHYLEGTEVWAGDDGPASRELGEALRAAPRRKVGKGWNVRVALSRPALRVARDYALDMMETGGIDYDSSWPSTGRTVLARVDAALALWNGES